jgi:hypothetical protein
VALYPRLKNSKYGPYREAWQLLQSGKVELIQACADERWNVAEAGAQAFVGSDLR